MTDSEELALAAKCSARLDENDFMSQASGMKILSTTAGNSQVAMTVTKNMLNGFATCHGGMIFSLADTAFAHACNNRNKANVAMDCRIDFLKPAFEGDLLTATARETHSGRRSSLYEITVTNQDETKIALFQGRSYYIGKPVLDTE